jgi:hypothetical protein
VSRPADRGGPALLRGRLRRSFLLQQANDNALVPQLTQLAELRARGLLTEQEYDRARQRILDD